MATVEETPTYRLNGVEVFSAGVWNNDKYEIQDLHKMVESFNALKNGFKPYLKLGHDEKQRIVKSSGLPSIGWVENLYVKGSKLLADFNYIPKAIFQLIKNRAYRKVSCEIYWDLDVNGTKYPRVLSGIALLGAETPGVMNLADILSQYNFLNENNYVGVYEALKKDDTFKTYTTELEHKTEEDEMSEENTEVKKELEEKKEYAAKLEVAKSELEKQLQQQTEELNKFKQEAERAIQAEKAAKTAQFITELESKKLVTPAMKEYVAELLSDKKEYTVKEKQISKEDMLTEILTLSQEAAKVNFTESSKAEFAKKEDKQKELDGKIEKYQQEHKCSYAQAVKAVMKEQKPEDNKEE